jgi:hypothetical protein
MKKQYLFIFTMCITLATNTFAQSTAAKVYNIFQNKCVQCHSSALKTGGLDLEGTGVDAAAKMADVYSKVFNKNPQNAVAAAKGDKLIYPGRPDRSFIFRKVNEMFEKTVKLDANEGAAMPKTINKLTDREKELIRQWVGFGANSTGNITSEALIDDYYNGNGLDSYPNGAPAPPPVGEGFQVKMNPFFIKADGELEYYQKHEMNLPEDVEVTRMELLMSNSSHHLIVYNFTDNAASIPAGLRLDANHNNINLVAAVQEATDLKLPAKTAFKWAKNIILDLNSHYINYSLTKTYKAEAYLNVYTQKVGKAKQTMYAQLFPNTAIIVPNNGNKITFERNVTSNPSGQIYLWGVMGHTHKYGTGYKIYERKNNAKGALMYDAGCSQGTPGCVSPMYDYKHIPMRYFEPLRPLKMSAAEGVTHEATWVNNGSKSVLFGATSDDEMMVMIMFYTKDTLGLTGNSELEKIKNVLVYPNPVIDAVNFELSPDIQSFTLSVFDNMGRLIRRETDIEGNTYQLQRGDLPKGIFHYRIETAQHQWASGNLIFE